MKKVRITGICILALSLLAPGCVARTYNLTRDRLDQDLSPASGNRGYIMGSAPEESKERKTTRTTRVFEIELGATKQQTKYQPAAPAAITAIAEEPVLMEESEQTEEVREQTFEIYTVAKNDTLQKISMKFYGTTKKWPKIYEANKNVLRSPDRLYAGQTIKIPVESELQSKTQIMLEPEENLK